jgi:hypothetical protein
MFGSDSSRHARGRGRGKAASLDDVLAELAHVRSQSYVDGLEVVRLGALVNGLTQHIDRLGQDLQAARTEALSLRMMPTTVDPRIEQMAREILQLRDVIAAQQSSIVDMTTRVGDLLIQVASAAPREPIASPAPPAPERQDAPVTVMAAARAVGSPTYDDGFRSEPAAHAAASVTSDAEVAMLGVDNYAFAVAPSPSAAAAEPTGEFDDATLRRLRLIRQAFEN